MRIGLRRWPIDPVLERILPSLTHPQDRRTGKHGPRNLDCKIVVMLHNLSLLRIDRLRVRSDESKRWACGVDADAKELFPDSRRGLNLGLSTASLLPRQIHDQVCQLHFAILSKG